MYPSIFDKLIAIAFNAAEESVGISTNSGRVGWTMEKSGILICCALLVVSHPFSVKTRNNIIGKSNDFLIGLGFFDLLLFNLLFLLYFFIGFNYLLGFNDEGFEDLILFLLMNYLLLLLFDLLIFLPIPVSLDTQPSKEKGK